MCSNNGRLSDICRTFIGHYFPPGQSNDVRSYTSTMDLRCSGKRVGVSNPLHRFMSRRKKSKVKGKFKVI